MNVWSLAAYQLPFLAQHRHMEPGSARHIMGIGSVWRDALVRLNLQAPAVRAWLIKARYGCSPL